MDKKSDPLQLIKDSLAEASRLMTGGEERQAVKKLEAAVAALTEEYKRYKFEYARDLIEQVKANMINVGPNQTKLQTLPYQTGKDKEEADRVLKAKKRKK
jgi:hypothetical protein